MWMTAAAMGGFVSILPHCLPVIGSVQQKRAAQVQTWQPVLEDTIDAWAKIFSPYDGCPKAPTWLHATGRDLPQAAQDRVMAARTSSIYGPLRTASRWTSAAPRQADRQRVRGK